MPTCSNSIVALFSVKEVIPLVRMCWPGEILARRWSALVCKNHVWISTKSYEEFEDKWLARDTQTRWEMTGVAIELRIVVVSENAVETTTRWCHVIKPIETFSIVKKRFPKRTVPMSVTARYHARRILLSRKFRDKEHLAGCFCVPSREWSSCPFESNGRIYVLL